MKHLLTLLMVSLSMSAYSQTQITIPYNPDGNADGLISLNDLLDILSIYGSEYSPTELVNDDHSALLYLGDMDYFDCASSCEGLQGNWKILDELLVGRYKTELASMGSTQWLDRRVLQVNQYSYVPVLESNSGGYYFTQDSPQGIYSCVCQTRVVQPIIVPVGPCESGLDACGVCDGPGPIYECGCHNIPAGACDCEGNQFDALGVCGGDCLGDYDGDGVCDVFPEGPCQGQNTINYQGFDYDIVEIGGKCWFADDLRTQNYTNGDEIPNILSTSTWDTGTGAWSVSEGYEYNGNVYNWHAVLDPRGLCPSGWHVPSRQDYINLVDSLYADPSIGSYPNVNVALKDDMSWDGTNQSGFKARSTFYRGSNGNFSTDGSYNKSWTSDYGTFGQAYYFRLVAGVSSGITQHYLTGDYSDQGYGFAIRCMSEDN
jgi:uncharacterized protein (TIGR02145 family)